MKILTGDLANIAVFVDEMTVFNMRSSETSLGGRYELKCSKVPHQITKCKTRSVKKKISW